MTVDSSASLMCFHFIHFGIEIMIHMFSLQIWVQSSHNASGYFTIYGDESDYADHFSARLVTGNTGEVYARTGYLGFLRRTECSQQQGGTQLSVTTTLLGGSTTAISQTQSDTASGGEEDDTPALSRCHAAATAASATSGLAAHQLLSTPHTASHLSLRHSLLLDPVCTSSNISASQFLNLREKNESVNSFIRIFKQYCSKSTGFQCTVQLYL